MKKKQQAESAPKPKPEPDWRGIAGELFDSLEEINRADESRLLIQAGIRAGYAMARFRDAIVTYAPPLPGLYGTKLDSIDFLTRINDIWKSHPDAPK